MSDSILSTYRLFPMRGSDNVPDEDADCERSLNYAKRSFVAYAKEFSEVIGIELVDPQSAIDQCWGDVMGI